MNLPEKKRWIFLWEPVEAIEIASLNKDLMELWISSPRRRIALFINSTGGEEGLGTGFYDFVRTFRIPLVTIGMGEVCSAAIFVFLAGQRRYTLTSDTRFMFHPTEAVTDKKTSMTSLELRLQTQGVQLGDQVEGRILMKETGLSKKEATRLLDSHQFLTATQLQANGLVHGIFGKEESVGLKRQLQLVRR